MGSYRAAYDKIILTWNQLESFTTMSIIYSTWSTSINGQELHGTGNQAVFWVPRQIYISRMLTN